MPNKTIIQKPVVKADLKDVHLYLVSPGNLTWGANYVPKDETGAVIGTEPRNVSGTVTQDPGLWAWVDSVVIVAINEKEGTA